MNADPEPAALVEAITALREEVARLGDRVAELETAAWVEPERLDPELILVIGAAIAAFLGKKAHIRQVRLHTSPTWVQVGRVNIQGSHALTTHRSGAAP